VIPHLTCISKSLTHEKKLSQPQGGFGEGRRVSRQHDDETHRLGDSGGRSCSLPYGHGFRVILCVRYRKGGAATAACRYPGSEQRHYQKLPPPSTRQRRCIAENIILILGVSSEGQSSSSSRLISVFSCLCQVRCSVAPPSDTHFFRPCHTGPSKLPCLAFEAYEVERDISSLPRKFSRGFAKRLQPVRLRYPCGHALRPSHVLPFYLKQPPPLLHHERPTPSSSSSSRPGIVFCS
jgi:hypothetical protein